MSNESIQGFPDIFDVSEGIKAAPVYVIVYVLIYGTSALIGTFGNILIITITFLSRHLRNSRNAFICSLSVADLLVSVVIMPASIIGVLLGKKWYEDKSGLCLMTSMLCAPSCVVSMHCLAWIAISRYYFIGQYPLYLKYFTKYRITGYIIMIWIIGFMVHTPNHFGWGKVRYSFMLRYCSLDTETISYAVFYAAVLGSGVAIAFIFYLKTYLVIRKSKLSKTLIVGRPKDDRNERNTLSDEMKILKATFKIFILLLISWSPAVFLLFLSLGDKIPPWAYLYAAMLSHINSTLNFLVYFFGNEVFKNAVKEVVFKTKTTRVRTITVNSYASMKY